MAKYDFAPTRRRRSPLLTIFVILLVLIVGLIIYLSMVDTEVPIERVEQDGTMKSWANKPFSCRRGDAVFSPFRP